jgi:hypothetical protein
MAAALPALVDPTGYEGQPGDQNNSGGDQSALPRSLEAPRPSCVPLSPFSMLWYGLSK